MIKSMFNLLGKSIVNTLGLIFLFGSVFIFFLIKTFALLVNFYSILKSFKRYQKYHLIIVKKMFYVYCFKKHPSRLYKGSVSNDDYHKFFKLFENIFHIELVFYNPDDFYKNHGQRYVLPKSLNQVYLRDSLDPVNQMLYGNTKFDHLKNLHDLYPIIEFIINFKSIFSRQTYSSNLENAFRPFSINLIVFNKDKTLKDLIQDLEKTEYLLKAL